MSNSEEAEILRQMIADRDQRIALILRKQEDMKEKEERLHRDTEDLRYEIQDLKVTHQTEKTRLLHSRASIDSQLETLQNDLQRQGNSLSSYAAAMTRQSTSNVDSGYIMQVQAQLCKAMHTMGILDHQFEIAQQGWEDLVKAARDCKAEMTDDKTKLEMQLLNDMMTADISRRDAEAELLQRLEDVQRQVVALREEVEDREDIDEDEDEEEEETQEERDAKEELQQVLDEKKAEIVRLEAELEAQLVVIDDLEAQTQGKSEEQRKTEIEAKAQARADEKREKEEPSTPKSSRREESIDQLAELRASVSMDSSENDDGPAHVPLENEEVLAIAKKRAEERASARNSGERGSSGQIDEFDLLNLARARLTGSTAVVDEDSEQEDETEEAEEFSESFNDEEEMQRAIAFARQQVADETESEVPEDAEDSEDDDIQELESSEALLQDDDVESEDYEAAPATGEGPPSDDEFEDAAEDPTDSRVSVTNEDETIEKGAVDEAPEDTEPAEEEEQ